METPEQKHQYYTVNWKQNKLLLHKYSSGKQGYK
jgi:hypothetical protein